MNSEFSRNVIKLIGEIPSGWVSTYGTIAFYAGNPSGARQVARLLHSSSKKYNLPWHRVINREGKISLSQGNGYEKQKELLIREGIVFDERDRIDLDSFLWLSGL